MLLKMSAPCFRKFQRGLQLEELLESGVRPVIGGRVGRMAKASSGVELLSAELKGPTARVSNCWMRSSISGIVSGVGFGEAVEVDSMSGTERRCSGTESGPGSRTVGVGS